MPEKKDYLVQGGMLPGQFIEVCEEILRIRELSSEKTAYVKAEIERARAQSPFAQLKIRREEGLVFHDWVLSVATPFGGENA